MKKLLVVLVATLCMYGVAAQSVGGSITPGVTTQELAPEAYACGSRVVLDDAVAPGRVSPDGTTLVERINNYAFEGEQIGQSVLIFDQNGIDTISDVTVTVGTSQGVGNPDEAGCVFAGFVGSSATVSTACGVPSETLALIASDTAAMYDCLFTVEDSTQMTGEHYITVEVEDSNGDTDIMDENEFWFLNPAINLGVTGSITFNNLVPGTTGYSETIIISNSVDPSSGVMLDMFIGGTDFTDGSSSGALCPTSNVLELSNFAYYATNGAYNTAQDVVYDVVDGDRSVDAEGYVNIDYANGFNDPNPFYNNHEIIQTGDGVTAPGAGTASTLIYWPANILAPGADMALTFKLNLPSPCTGTFDEGEFRFWGETI